MMTLEQALQRVQVLEEELAKMQLQMVWLKKKLFGGGQGLVLGQGSVDA